MIRVGDKARPRPEWRDDANRVPYGRVRAVVPWGDCGVIYVEGDHRGFYAGIFEIDDYDANADFAGLPLKRSQPRLRQEEHHD